MRPTFPDYELRQRVRRDAAVAIYDTASAVSSRASRAWAQLGYIVPMGDLQGYFNVKAWMNSD